MEGGDRFSFSVCGPPRGETEMRQLPSLYPPRFAAAQEDEVNIMSKSMDTKKDSKKKPAKSMKEKRADKKAKKESKSK